MNLSVEVHQQRVDREVAPAEIFLKGGRPHVGLPRVGRVRLGAGGDELDQVPGKGHLRRAIAFERHRRLSSRQLCEALGELESVTALDDHVWVWVRPPQKLVAHVAADDPGAHA